MFIGLFDRSTGALVLDLGRHGQGAVFGTNEHGFAECTLSVARDVWTQAQWLDWPGALEVLATWNGVTVWQGRVEDITAVNDAIRVTALGYQRALSDVPYTALWSTASYAAWRAWTQDDRSTAWPERYVIDNNNRLYIAPQKNATFGNTGGNKAGTIGLAAPNGGARKIVACSFNYELLAPVNWQAGLNCYTGSPAGTVTNIWNLASTGALQTGSQNLTFTGDDYIAFYFLYNAADAVYAGETGAAYLKITNLRVKTTTSPAVYADEIAGALAAFVAAVNGAQLDSSTTLLQSPAVDLMDEDYADAWPAEVLNQLSALGDNATPPRRWEWGVFEDRRLHLRPRGSAGRAWYVDASAAEIQRTLETLANSVYTVYQDGRNETQRTAAAADAESATRYGVTRRAAVSAQTTSATQAAVIRDAALADGATPRPRSAITFEALYDAAGARWPLWACRSGDTITVRNFPVAASGEIDRVRTFVVSETRYSVEADRLEVVPESALPRLEVLVARRGEGLR